MSERHAHPGGDLSAATVAELDRLLAEPAVWGEPRAELAERVLDAITAAATAERADDAALLRSTARQHPTPRRRRPWYSVVAVAAALVVGFCLAIGLSGDRQHSPTRFTVALRGTALAPGASGEATLTRTESGWKVYLDAVGLPRRVGDGYYEAWLKNDDGVLVPIGTFNEPHDVLLWAGVAPTAYPTLTVTRQLIGDQASSGQVVVAGAAEPER
jgi:hypothetical protein